MVSACATVCMCDRCMLCAIMHVMHASCEHSACTTVCMCDHSMLCARVRAWFGGLKGCIIGGPDQACPLGYVWPPTTPPPKLEYDDLQSAGKVGLKFLAGWGFTAMDSLVANPLEYLQAFWRSQGLDGTLAAHHTDPTSGHWYSFTFPGISLEDCLPEGQTAWHGTTIFALPSIIKMKKLVPGSALPKGIYCHRMGSASKAQSYMCHTPIGHGLLLAPMLKLRVISPRKVRVDQWLVEEANCSIEKVFVRVVRISGLEPGREWLTKPWMEQQEAPDTPF